MVLSRNDKRKRKEGDLVDLMDPLSGANKRPKVHAQRKFAQGAATIFTPSTSSAKEKEKPKPQIYNDVIANKCPNTESFLTFLCFRGTSILPPTLNYFNLGSKKDKAESKSSHGSNNSKGAPSSSQNTSAEKASSSKASQKPSAKAKTASPTKKPSSVKITNTVVNRKAKFNVPMHKVQALKKKLQGQRLVKPTLKTKFKTSNVIRTRSCADQVIKSINKLAPRIMPAKAEIKRFGLRSGAHDKLLKGLPAKLKSCPLKTKKKIIVKTKPRESSQSNSESESPKAPAKKSEKKVVRKVVVRQRIETKRVTRSYREETTTNVTRRPTRKTKEAAAVYMEILGRKLVSPDLENDEDNVSVDSFPELPNVKKSTQTENEMKAKVRLSTRNAAKEAKSEIASLRLRRVNRNIVKETKPVLVKNKRQLKLKRYCEIESEDESEWSEESDRTTKPVTRNSSKEEKDKTEEKTKPDHNLRSGAKKTPSEKKEESKPKKETVGKNSKGGGNSKEESKKPLAEKKKKVDKSQEGSKKRKEEKNDEASEEETLGELLSRMNKKKDDAKESKKDEKEIKKEPAKVPKTSDVKEKAVEKLTAESTEEPQKKTEMVQPLFEMTDYKMSDDEESFVGFSKKSISKALSILSPEDGDLVMDVEPDPGPEESKSEVESIKPVQEEKKPVMIEVKKPPEVKVDKCAHETKVCVPNIINMSQSSSAWKEKLNMSNERIERWLSESSLAKETNKIEMEGESNFKFEVPELKKPGPRHHLSISTKIQHLVRPVNVTLSKLGEKTPRTMKLVKPVNFEAKALAKQHLLDLKNKLMKPPETKDETPSPAKVSKPSTVSVETTTEKVPEESKSDVDSKEKSFEKDDSEKGLSPDKKSSQPRKLFQKKINERKDATPSASAFSPENESSVYAFESDNETMPVGTPFRRKNKGSGESTPVKTDQEDKTSSKDEDVESSSESSCQVKPGKVACRNFELPKNFGMANMQVLPLEKLSTNWSNVNCSSSIAVQVNLDEPTEDSMEQDEDDPERQKCNEISTQTDSNAENDNEDDTNGHLFYIPLQAVTRNGSNLVPGQQLIQGVAVKFDTEGPTGPNQRVLLKAKLVTKPPITVARCPPIGTVQPTTRPPPSAESEGTASTSVVLEAEASTSTSKVDSSVKSVQSPEKKKDKTKSPKVVRERKSTGETAKGKRLSLKSKLKAAEVCSSNKTSFPSKSANEEARLVEAPTFHPTEKDFQDPLEYIDKIRPIAEKFGICRVVPPPNFKPECKVSDDMRFTAYNQYVHKMLHRWGPNVKEMMAIKKYLATQSITLTQPPWIGGMEVDLPHLYQTVQSLGGLKEVIEKKKWQKVADGMKIPRSAQDRVTKLDDIYCKYLLPYDTLSPEEREKLFDEVEAEWKKKESRSLQRQESQSTDEDDESDDGSDDIEECIVKGRNMPLNAFYRIARNTQRMWFGENQRSNSEVEGASAEEVETAFWKHVSEKKRHVCVHNASIDSSGRGFGFSVAKNSPFARHPWNLKVLTNNAGSVLRALGPLMGVTVPTLHVGMLFSACCWYRDPHGLPWIEYLHTGAKKIWYGIPDEHNNSFRDALMKMVPRYCKNKTIWLPSDTAMVPPEMLVRNGVPLCHTVQEPGQFIIVFPKAFTSSICTGYVVSESVYFAQPLWLDTAEQVFQDIKDSCEPTVFSLEKLLISTINDSRSQLSILNQILPTVKSLWEREIKLRNELLDFGLINKEKLPSPESGKRGKGKKIMEEEGDFECETCRANLSLSLVSNSQDESVYCLAHALQLLKQKKSMLKDCTLMYTYDNSELLDLIDKLQERINAKSKKTNQIKK